MRCLILQTQGSEMYSELFFLFITDTSYDFFMSYRGKILIEIEIKATVIDKKQD